MNRIPERTSVPKGAPLARRRQQALKRGPGTGKIKMNEHKSIEQIENEIVEEFSLFDSWDDKYEYIIDLGKKLSPLEAEYKVDENKVRGCQSTVYLVADYKDGRIFYKAESDAVIVKGLISMLIRVLSGQKPEDVMKAPLNFINE